MALMDLDGNGSVSDEEYTNFYNMFIVPFEGCNTGGTG